MSIVVRVTKGRKMLCLQLRSPSLPISINFNIIDLDKSKRKISEEVRSMKKTIYHYTTPEGAYSILKEKTLWFTDCQYLNDMSEFVYIREPFIEAYRRICLERGESIDDIETFADSMCKTSAYKSLDWEAVLSRHKLGRGWPLEYRYFMLCASRDHDTANMWNYYVKNGMYRGYNLGLDINVIRNWFSERECEISNIRLVHGEVIYDKQRQVAMLYKKLVELLKSYDQYNKQFSSNSEIAIEDFQNDLSSYITEKKLFFKHPAFSSEKEYRFILKAHTDFQPDDNLEMKFRVGSSGIITPFIEWRFGDLKQMLLKQITLSPMIEEELAKESFKRFLRRDVYQNISIVPSSIKLRF